MKEKTGYCQITGIRCQTEYHHILGRDRRRVVVRALGIDLNKYDPFIIEISQPVHMQHARHHNTVAFVEYIFHTHGAAELRKFIDCCDVIGTQPKLRFQAWAVLVREGEEYYKSHARKGPLMDEEVREEAREEARRETERRERITKRRKFAIYAFIKKNKITKGKFEKLTGYYVRRLQTIKIMKETSWRRISEFMEEYGRKWGTREINDCPDIPEIKEESE